MTSRPPFSSTRLFLLLVFDYSLYRDLASELLKTLLQIRLELLVSFLLSRTPKPNDCPVALARSWCHTHFVSSFQLLDSEPTPCNNPSRLSLFNLLKELIGLKNAGKRVQVPHQVIVLHDVVLLPDLHPLTQRQTDVG